MGKIFCDNCLNDIPDNELCFVIKDRKTGLEVALCTDCLGLSDFMQKFIKKNFARWLEIEQNQSTKGGSRRC